MDVTFDESGLKIALTALIEPMLDLAPIMPVIGEILVSSIEENFLVGGRYGVPGSWMGGNNRWPPLGTSTVRKRMAKGGGATPILQDTGALAASFQHEENGNSVTITNNRAYFAIHQFGGIIHHPGGTPYVAMGSKGVRFLKKDGVYPPSVRFTAPHDIILPPRPMLVIQDEDIEEMLSVIANHFNRLK